MHLYRIFYLCVKKNVKKKLSSNEDIALFVIWWTGSLGASMIMFAQIICPCRTDGSLHHIWRVAIYDQLSR